MRRFRAPPPRPPRPLPEPDPAVAAAGAEAERQRAAQAAAGAAIARIDALSALARTTWFGLLAYLAFVGITLLGVEDADFFVPSRQTQLPLINVAIPTQSFFWFAPVLGAALYAYLHFQLVKLWDALAEPPPRPGGRALADRVYPWLVNDLALALRADGAAQPGPLTWLSNLVTRLLVWAAAPLVLAGFWWRAMPAHEEWLTLLNGLCLLLALHVGFTSWRVAWARLAGNGRAPRAGPGLLGTTLALVVVVVGWLRTEGGLDHYAGRAIDLFETATAMPVFEHGRYEDGQVKWNDWVQAAWIAEAPFIPTLQALTFSEESQLVGHWLADGNDWTAHTWSPLAGIALGQDRLAEPPDAWRDAETTRRARRRAWCAARDIPAALCEQFRRTIRASRDFLARSELAELCRAAGREEEECRVWLIDAEQAFREDWQTERRAAIRRLDRTDLSGRDLRGADMRGAFLVGADLREARLDGADLFEADLEGAVLRRAQLRAADLDYASLQDADFNWSDLRGASFANAELQDARFLYSQAEGARFYEAVLDGASFTTVRLESADFSSASMRQVLLAGAIMTGASIGPADLTGAAIQNSSFEDARMGGVRLTRATVTRTSLAGASLQNALLRDSTFGDAPFDGAVFDYAVLDGARFRRSTFNGARLRSVSLVETAWDQTPLVMAAPQADFRGGRGLSQAVLDGVVGDRLTLLPETPDPETGAPLHVWTCWKTMPEAVPAASRERLAEFLCGDGVEPERTGTPLPLDQPVYHIMQRIWIEAGRPSFRWPAR